MLNLKKTFCHDYLKLRVNGLIDIPFTLDDCLNAEEDHKDYDFIMKLCDLLLLNPFEYVDEPKAGYSFFVTYDEDVYVFGGREGDKTQDGEHTSYVELKGHALRMFEKRCLEKEIDPFEQYCKLMNFFFANQSNERQLTFKRIDVALDDYSNLISIMELQKKLRKGYYVSNTKKVRFDYDYNQESIIDYNEEDGIVKEISTDKGFSCYIGGKTSRQLNIYDKKAERESNDNIVIVPYWMRYEARFYQDNANSCFSFLYHNIYKDSVKEKFNWAVGSLIRKIIILKEDNKYNAMDQSKALNWTKWDELTESTEDCVFKAQYEKEKDISFIKSKTWLINSPYMNITLEFLIDSKIEYDESGKLINNNLALPTLYESNGIYFNDYFIKFILQLLNKGKDKLDTVKLAKVNNYRTARGMCRIKNILDAQSIINDYVMGEGDFSILMEGGIDQ